MCVQRLIGLRCLCLGLITLVLAGCGTPEFAPVSGAVTYNGEPIGGATVTFMPADGKKLSYATTEADGTYRLAIAGERDRFGAAVGENRVKVSAIAESGGQSNDPDLGSLPQMGAAKKIEYLIPPKYFEYESSGLSFTVPASGSTEADFALAD